MRVMVDLNVILDVLMDRAPFSAMAKDILDDGRPSFFVSSHMVTTAAYLTGKISRKAQEGTLDFILENFTVVPCDGALLSSARALGFADYEDAVVAMAAKKARCANIVACNVRDFASSRVPIGGSACFLFRNFAPRSSYPSKRTQSRTNKTSRSTRLKGLRVLW